LETIRPIKGYGRSRHFLVRAGCNDSFDLAQHQQVQLARWPEKSRHKHGAKRTPAIARSSNQVLKLAFQPDGGFWFLRKLPSVFDITFLGKGRNHGHAQF